MLKRSLLLLIVVMLLVPSCRREAPARPSQEAAPAAGAETQPEPAGEPLTVGSRMPRYAAKTTDGKAFDLASLRGNVILLNIWATWCGPCRIEIPDLIELQKRHGTEGLTVVGISVDQPGMEKEVADFAKEQGINYPILLDPDGRIADIFQTSVVPTSALVGPDGKLSWFHLGVVSADDPKLNQALRKGLAAR